MSFCNSNEDFWCFLAANFEMHWACAASLILPIEEKFAQWPSRITALETAYVALPKSYDIVINVSGWGPKLLTARTTEK